MDGFEIEIPVEGILQEAFEQSSVLPDPATYSYYKFANRRKLFLDFEICEESMDCVRRIMAYNIQDTGKPRELREPIWIYIMNDGGDASVMWAIIDAIQTSATPVYTVNMGMCASAAAFIFIAGERRLMMPRSNVMIHEGSAQFTGDAVKVRDQARAYEEQLRRLNQYILSRTSIPADILESKRDNDWTLTAEECLKYNVCTSVIQSMDEIL